MNISVVEKSKDLTPTIQEQEGFEPTYMCK